MRWALLLGLILIGQLGAPGVALAHDDPIVTVRVLCNGFNALDMDAVLGELAGTATLTVDQPVHGASEVEAWVRRQMDQDLRIEIVDLGTPQRLPDGYTLSWTGRFSRADWRNAGVMNREVNNVITIHNGRITEWTATLAPLAADASAAQAASPGATQPLVSGGGAPEVMGVPLTLWLAIGMLGLAGVWVARRLLR